MSQVIKPVLVKGATFSEITTIRRRRNDCSSIGDQFEIDSGATVVCSLLSRDKSTELIEETATLSTDTGADWPRSKILAQFTATQTDTLTSGGDAYLRIKITDGATVDIADVAITVDA